MDSFQWRNKVNEMTKQKWAEMNRDLRAGDIIRAKVSNKLNSRYGEYAYGIATGEGFGSSMSSIGNAIYVRHAGYDLERIMSYREGTVPEGRVTRWERSWGIEILIEE
jgi:hypothetical protein